MPRDFRSPGISFETDRSFFPGQPIEFNITLEHADPEGPIQVTCRGEIIEVEEIGQKIGVASAIDSYTFQELPSVGPDGKRRTQ